MTAWCGGLFTVLIPMLVLLSSATRWWQLGSHFLPKRFAESICHRCFRKSSSKSTHLCSGCVQRHGCPGLAFCCGTLSLAKVAMLDLADTNKYSPWISFKEECASCKSSACSLIFHLHFQWHCSHFVKDPCRPLYTVSRGITTKQTRDCCVYLWLFSGGLSFAFTKAQMIPVIKHLVNLINRLQLNFLWNPLHLFTWSAIQWVWYLHASTEQWEPLGVWLTSSCSVKAGIIENMKRYFAHSFLMFLIC